MGLEALRRKAEGRPAYAAFTRSCSVSFSPQKAFRSVLTKTGSGSVWSRSLTESTLSFLVEGFEMTDRLRCHFERGDEKSFLSQEPTLTN